MDNGWHAPIRAIEISPVAGDEVAERLQGLTHGLGITNELVQLLERVRRQSGTVDLAQAQRGVEAQ